MNMSKGILHLALDGRVSLQLEYREPKLDICDLEGGIEMATVDAMASQASFFTATLDSLHAEN